MYLSQRNVSSVVLGVSTVEPVKKMMSPTNESAWMEEDEENSVSSIEEVGAAGTAADADPMSKADQQAALSSPSQPPVATTTAEGAAVLLHHEPGYEDDFAVPRDHVWNIVGTKEEDKQTNPVKSEATALKSSEQDSKKSDDQVSPIIAPASSTIAASPRKPTQYEVKLEVQLPEVQLPGSV